MKSFGLFCCILLTTLSARAELDTLWTASLPLSLETYTYEDVAVLANGECMTVARSGTNNELLLSRISVTGQSVWTGSIPVEAAYPEVIGLTQMDEGHLILVVSAFTGDSVIIDQLVLTGLTATGEVLWSRSYELNGTTYLGNLCTLSDNTIALYLTVNSNNGGSYGLLAKVDSDGDTLWTRHAGPDAANVTAMDVAEVGDRELVLTGHYAGPTGYDDGYVIRTSATGVPVWTRTYSLAENQRSLFCTSLCVAPNDNILVGGIDAQLWWSNFPWAISLTPDGDTIWTVANGEAFEGGVSGVRYTVGGGAILVANTAADFGFMHGQVFTADPQGELSHEFELTGFSSQFTALTNDGAHGAVAFGTFTDGDWNNIGYLMRIGPNTTVTGFVRALDTNAPILGAKVELVETGDVAYSDVQGIYSLGLSQPSGTLRVSSPCITPQERTVAVSEGEEAVENFIVGAPTYENDQSSINMVATFNMIERDTLHIQNHGNGDLHFTTTVHEQTPAYGWLFASPASGVVAPGTTAEIIVTIYADAAHPEFEFFGEVQIHHNSCPDTVDQVGVIVLALDSPERPAPPREFSLHPAYPNPFNNSARVAFDLPTAARVTATLYSIEGRAAGSIADANFPAGRHELALNGDALATGVYILRLTAGRATATQKLVLLK
ncbi:MAG: T9SS type A sorting domain-containing protein [bacterium]|nr:T9SS type A sorting domain-containing protein [bacterium]